MSENIRKKDEQFWNILMHIFASLSTLNNSVKTVAITYKNMRKAINQIKETVFM